MGTAAPLRPRPTAAVTPGLLVALLAGCRPDGVLVGPTGEHRLVARDDDSRVTVVLTTGTWDGEPRTLPQDVTVVHVLVANMGPRTIRLAPGDFQLRSARGFRYRVLDAGGSFQVAASGDGGQDGGYAPARASYPLGEDPDVVTFRSSSRDIHAYALPWGYLLPGTDMRGFLYFEKAEDTAKLLRMTFSAHDDRGAQVADFVFDLATARPRRGS